ncbi:MAG: hypothetical protein ACODAU_05165 [Myxococcota bacterium]
MDFRAGVVVRAAFPVLLSGALCGAACHRADPCPHTDACPEGTVCRHDGTCGPLEREDLQFAVSRRLPVRDWAIRHDDGSEPGTPPDDVLPIGGPHGAAAHLEIGPLPLDLQLARAVLALHPDPSWPGAGHPWRLGVHRGPAPDTIREARPGRRKYHPAQRVVRLRAGAGRPTFIDVTPTVATALNEGLTRVVLVVRALDRGPPLLRFASPRATDPRDRPHLHLLAK